MRSRVLIAIAAALVLAGISVGYLRFANASSPSDAAQEVSLTAGPRFLARSTADGSKGRIISVSRVDGSRTVSGLACDRLYAAGGVGACLRPDGPLATYQVVVLDSALREKQSLPLVGVPSRVRVSPSGRMVTWTVFVTGDSYNGGRFSTRAGILDLRTGALEGTLEDFSVFVDGAGYSAADLNFWGVTFTPDDNRFYATMSTNGHRYLVLGDFAARTVRTIHEGVECPSLSPDGARLAFKSAVDGDPAKGWRLSTLELATGKVTPLAETRSVDDQPAWLDAGTIGYGLPRGGGHSDVWAVPADGSGQPRLLIADAESPAALG
jgi:hypothetical protein